MGSDPISSHVGSSFEDWYRSEYRSIVHSLVLITGNGDVAVDAASEACARALERWERVSMMASPSDGPTPWASMLPDGLYDGQEWKPSSCDRRLFHHRSVRTRWSCGGGAALPHQQRVAVVLHYVADLSQRDVASVMGVAEGTVAATLHTARKRLADSLGQTVEARRQNVNDLERSSRT